MNIFQKIHSDPIDFLLRCFIVVGITFAVVSLVLLSIDAIARPDAVPEVKIGQPAKIKMGSFGSPTKIVLAELIFDNKKIVIANDTVAVIMELK